MLSYIKIVNGERRTDGSFVGKLLQKHDVCRRTESEPDDVLSSFSIPPDVQPRPHYSSNWMHHNPCYPSSVLW